MLRLHKTLNLAETNESSMKIFSLDSYKVIVCHKKNSSLSSSPKAI